MKETAAAIDPEAGSNDVKAMEKEIHRMRIRGAQFAKLQESLIHEVEQAVTRRAPIAVKGQSHNNTSELTQAQLQKKVLEINRKLKQALSDAGTCDRDIRELLEVQTQINARIQETAESCRQLDDMSDIVDEGVAALWSQKAAWRDQKYIPACKTEEALQNAMQKYGSQRTALQQVVEALYNQDKEKEEELRPVSIMFSMEHIESL
eukprot:Clim_evm42s239 gene=Clim_evmTU42s239